MENKEGWRLLVVDVDLTKADEMTKNNSREGELLNVEPEKKKQGKNQLREVEARVDGEVMSQDSYSTLFLYCFYMSSP